MTELGKYTAHARVVLEDCRQLLEEFRDDGLYLKHRFRWVAALALLRAVGHVLDKVDGSSSPAAREVISRAWEALNTTKPEPHIFWRFIDQGRNMVLKEYRLGIQTIVSANVQIYRDPQQAEEHPATPATISYLVTFGDYKGRPQKQVIREAIEWWEGYLDAIDASDA